MRRTPLAWAMTAVLVVLTLSGCGRVTTDIAVHEDGTYDLSMVLAGDETELATAGYTPEGFSQLLTDEFASQPGIEDLVVSDYRQDGYAGVEITGENISGDDVGMFGRGVVTTDADAVRFTLQYPITIITGSLPPEQTEAVEIRTTVSFPGEVTDHNGTLVDDVTVEWTGTGSTDLDYTASSAVTGAGAQPAPDAPSATPTDGASDEAIAAESDGDDASAWVLPLAVGLAVLALAGLGTWLVLRSRKNGGQGGPGAPQLGHQGPQGQQWGPPPPPPPQQP